ncbi:MAG TPA: MBL fold metallo-hydrolase [Polyangia bacterium]|jgi:L-ascorbate metabolism protein UlaG (beta-lactamase superfamily)|nr:MBL fold metallo-hydrolase [Polyangia bacterium]
MGRFDHLATQPQRGPADLLRWRFLDTIAGRRVRDPGGYVTPVRANDGAAIAAAPSSLTWIGHATFVLRLGGALVATDPIWSTRISGVIKRQAPPGVALESLPPIDVVTISHNHYDHLDLPTLKRIGKKTLFITPTGNGALLRAAGLPNLVELDWWQSHQMGALTITAVPARHWSMRAPWNRNDMLWSGFVFRGPEGAAYHAGDTALFDGFAEIAQRTGPIDWALLPIGAYEPRWFMQPQHMNPEDAGEAFARLGARQLVAMHWGTFKLTDEPMGEPPARLRQVFEQRGWDPARLWLLDIGETRVL